MEYPGGDLQVGPWDGIAGAQRPAKEQIKERTLRVSLGDPELWGGSCGLAGSGQPEEQGTEGQVDGRCHTV